VATRSKACLDRPRVAAIPPSSPHKCPGCPGVTLSGIPPAVRQPVRGLTGGGRGVTLSKPCLTLSNSGRPGGDPALIWPAVETAAHGQTVTLSEFGRVTV